MGIFNSVGQVVKNRKQFKQWEEQEADKQAQRDALYEKKQLDEETLKKAAAKGKVIMDVVDIMDTHSEEIAENVETAVMPVAQAVAPAALLGSGFLGFKFLDKAEKNASKAYEKFLEEDDAGKIYKESLKKLRDIAWKDNSSELYNYYYDLDESRYCIDYVYGKKLDNAFNKIDEMNIALEQKQQAKDAVAKLKEVKSKVIKAAGKKAFNNKMIAVGSAVAGIFVGAYILANVLGAKLQVRASRIARWQSREDLKDPKYFVQYTPEQVAQAQNNLEESNENKEENKKQVSFKGLGLMGGGVLGGGLFGKKDEDNIEKRNKGFFKTLFATMKDNKKYKEWSESYNIEDKKVKKDLTQEELIDAQKDKEIIQRVTKKINNNAEEYSEDMEVAAGVIIGTTPWLGLGVSSILNFIVNKTGIAKNSEEKHFKKFTEGLDDESKKAVEIAKKALDSTEKEGALGHIKKLGAIGTFIENIKVNGKNKDAKKGTMDLVKKVSDALLSTRYSRNIIIGVVGTYLTSLVGSLIGLKLQKASARAGRYKAKQEIANDPRNFVGYSEQDFKEVENVKAQKKTFGQKVVETVTFIPRVIKDYIDYEKFRKTESKQDKKLLKELTKLEVSEEQLNEAKDLQRKVFTTFENVDDKSQEYSESIEAVTEMTAPILPFMGIAITATPVVVALIKTFKGGSAHATEVLTNFFAKHTGFLKGKTAKKILGEVKDNIPKTLAETKLSSEASQVPNNEFLGDVADMLVDSKSTEEAMGIAKEVLAVFKNMVGDFKKTIDVNSVDADGIGPGVKALEKFSKNFDEYSAPRRLIDKLIGSGLNEKQLKKIIDNLEIIYKNIPAEEMKEILDCVMKEPKKASQMIQNGDIKKLFASKTAINIAAISAGTWSALTFVLTYALESIFAGMQKNAGKLGVMTALNEMDDEKYYADENTNFKGNISQEQTNNVQVVSEKPRSKMLEKMLKK